MEIDIPDTQQLDILALETPLKVGNLTSVAPETPLNVPISDENKTNSSSTGNLTEIDRLELFETIFSSKNSVKSPVPWSRCDIPERDIKAIQFSHCTARKNNIPDIVKKINSKKLSYFRTCPCIFMLWILM